MSEKLADFLEIFQDTNKTLIMLVILAVGGLFRFKGYITPEGFIDLAKTTTVSYFATSSVINFTGMIRDHLASKLPAVITNAIPELKEES